MRCIYRQKIFPLCWAYIKWEYLLDHQSESFLGIFTRTRSTERMAALLYTYRVELDNNVMKGTEYFVTV